MSANVTLPDDLLARAQAVAQQQGKSVDDFMAQAVKCEIARQLIASFQREYKPSGITEEQEMETVVKAVHDYRRGR